MALQLEQGISEWTEDKPKELDVLEIPQDIRPLLHHHACILEEGSSLLLEAQDI